MKKTYKKSLYFILACLGTFAAAIEISGCGSSSSSSSSAATTAVQVSWTAVSNATSYLVEEAVDGTSFSQVEEFSSSTTSWNPSSLVDGHIYYFRVRAINSGGYSPYSDITSISL